MSADLEIPMSVWDAVLDATKDAPFEAREHQQHAVEAAAPLIVAAELERLVEETDWAWAVGESLKRRAAELRGVRKAEQR